MVPGTRSNPRDEGDAVHASEIVSVHEAAASGAGPSEPTTPAEARCEVEQAIHEAEEEKPRGAAEQVLLEVPDVWQTLTKIESSLATLTRVMLSQAEGKEIQQVPAEEGSDSESDHGREDTDGYARPCQTCAWKSSHSVSPCEVRVKPSSSRWSRAAEGRHEPADYEVYPAHVAFKIYQKGLENSRCRRIGDGSFFAAKRSWDRLFKDFPVTKSTKKRLLPHAFEGDARNVYEEVAGLNPAASCEELWSLLEQRLCNEVHQSALRDRFFALRWHDKKESFERFATRLRSAALALPGVIDEGILLNRLKAGLPVRLQDQAALVSDNFDEVVSRVSCLSTAQMSRGEAVREVVEPRSGSALPTGNRDPGDGGQQPDDRFAHVRCHYCQQMGHIARHCDKKRADRAKEGEDQGGQPRPAGRNPKKE